MDISTTNALPRDGLNALGVRGPMRNGLTPLSSRKKQIKKYSYTTEMQLSESDVKLKELDARIVYYSNHSRYKPVIDALCTLKGVSLLSAFALATEIDDFARFKNGVHLSSWLGLTTAPIFQWRKDSKRPYY